MSWKVRTDPLTIGQKGFESRNVLPLEDHLPGVGFVVADNAVKQGPLPGAVRTDQSDDLSPIDLERNPVIGHQAAEVFGEIDYVEKSQGFSLSKKVSVSVNVIPAETGIQEKKTGFRVKPGMTNRKGLMPLCMKSKPYCFRVSIFVSRIYFLLNCSMMPQIPRG